MTERLLKQISALREPSPDGDGDITVLYALDFEGWLWSAVIRQDTGDLQWFREANPMRATSP